MRALSIVHFFDPCSTYSPIELHHIEKILLHTPTILGGELPNTYVFIQKPDHNLQHFRIHIRILRQTMKPVRATLFQSISSRDRLTLSKISFLAIQ